MAPREKVIAFRPDNDTFDAMTALRERDGVPFSEQIRRALRAWLEAKGAMRRGAITSVRTRPLPKRAISVGDVPLERRRRLRKRG